MHTKCKKTLIAQVRTLSNKKKTTTFFVTFLSLFCLFFFIPFILILWLVHVCLISSSIFFQPYNYGQLSGNSAFGQVALKWLAILSANYYFIHTVCVQGAITQIRLYICTDKSIIYCLSTQWVATFHKLVQLFFVLSVYNVVYCNNAHSKLKR